MSDTRCSECKHAVYLQDGTHECGIGDCPIKIRNAAIEDVLRIVATRTIRKLEPHEFSGACVIRKREAMLIEDAILKLKDKE